MPTILAVGEGPDPAVLTNAILGLGGSVVRHFDSLAGLYRADVLEAWVPHWPVALPAKLVELAEEPPLQPTPPTLPDMAPSFASPDLQEILATVQLTQVHQVCRGQGALMAVVDTGVDPIHVAHNCRGDGWVDYIIPDPDPWRDPIGHGSMVGAIVAAGAPEATIYPVKVTAGDVITSAGIMAALDHLAGLALARGQPVIANFSWGVEGHDLELPCSELVPNTLGVLDYHNLVLTSWAAGNNGGLPTPAQLAGYCCTNATPWSVSCGALTRQLTPQPYSSNLGFCSPFHPTVMAPTYGLVPYGPGYAQRGPTGGGTSAAAPLAAAALVLMVSHRPGAPLRHYSEALRMSRGPQGLLQAWNALQFWGARLPA